MTGSLAFDGAVGNVGSLIRNRSLSRSGGNILRSGDPADRPSDDRLAVSTARRDNLKDTIAALEKRLRGRIEQVNSQQRIV